MRNVTKHALLNVIHFVFHLELILCHRPIFYFIFFGCHTCLTLTCQPLSNVDGRTDQLSESLSDNQRAVQRRENQHTITTNNDDWPSWVYILLVLLACVVLLLVLQLPATPPRDINESYVVPVTSP